jgi:hypothetical protein
MSIDVEAGLYRHHEGGLYRVHSVGHSVVGAAEVEIPGEPMVHYQALYTSERFGKNHTWDRALADFTEILDIDGEQVPRFTRIPEPPLAPEGENITYIVDEDEERTIAYRSVNWLGEVRRNTGSSIEYEVIDGTALLISGHNREALYTGSKLMVPRGARFAEKGPALVLQTFTPPLNPTSVEVVSSSNGELVAKESIHRWPNATE